ncbi:unnamed protein product [Effrenium voratum]|uniref:Uncharacterized protein n=1 Tax=Effrenium voratum TaxID=2562239 RepID=A0AA36JFF1_9DINO|nr:unnamed protein product [Effrenium voratum]
MKGGRGVCCTCAQYVAGVCLVLCSLGFSLWASEQLSDERPASFLQMHSKAHRSHRAHKESAGHVRPGECPALLRQRYPDCRVVSSRAAFNVGGALRPGPDEKNTVLVYSALDLSPRDAGASLVGWAPKMDEVTSTCPDQPKISLVHHINIYSYFGASLDPGTAYRQEDLAERSISEETFRMLASHDKARVQTPMGHAERVT